MLGPVDSEVFQLSVRDSQVQLMAPRRAGSSVGHRVHDLSTWMEAWTSFMRFLTEISPGRISELLHYQATIVEANNNYGTEAWLAYDKKFQLALSLRPHAVSWAIIDTHLWQSAFTSKGRPTCSRCSLIHAGPGPVYPFCAGPSSLNIGGGQRIYLHNGKPVCRNFNRGSCKCSHAHVCSSCRGSYPESACPACPPQ